MNDRIPSKIDRTLRPPENGKCPFCGYLACRISMCKYQCTNCNSVSKTPEGLYGGWDCSHCTDRVECLLLAEVLLPYFD